MKNQIQILIKARKQGDHAIVRENNLIINGQIYHEPYEDQGNILKEALNKIQGKGIYI